MARFMRTVAEQIIGLQTFWYRFFDPFFQRVILLYRMVVSWYMVIWHKMAYDSSGRFSRTRSMISVIASILFIWFIPEIFGFVYHVSLFTFTYKHEQIYLTNSEEIYPELDIHSVKGCSSLPCDNDNSEYYRVVSTPFSDVYSLITNYSFFYPDNVATVPGVSKCDVVSYGFRFKSKLIKQTFDFYPYMLDTVCMPIIKIEPN